MSVRNMGVMSSSLVLPCLMMFMGNMMVLSSRF
jgi:hypothetical protein